MTGTTLWKIGTASAEGSEYEGEYRGTWVRFIRQTDHGFEPIGPRDDRMQKNSRTTTAWYGFVRQGNAWAVVAELSPRRQDAIAATERYIDDVIAGKYDPGADHLLPEVRTDRDPAAHRLWLCLAAALWTLNTVTTSDTVPAEGAVQ